MKRFLVFGGPYYYARGGMFDFLQDFDAADEAIEFAKSSFEETIVSTFDFGKYDKKQRECDCDFVHVVDTQERKMIYYDGGNY